MPSLNDVDVSLLHGWLPLTLQLVAGAALIAAIGWRDRRWRHFWLPLAIAGAALVAFFVAIRGAGLAGVTDSLPVSVWLWLGVAVAAVLVLLAGWRTARWWRRGSAVIAAALAAVACANGVNQFVGYYPTIGDALGNWGGRPVPGQVSLAQIRGITETTTTRKVVVVDIPPTYSHFRHRQELVYLPPIWFRSAHRPTLPAVEMISGEYGAPENWVRIGHAVRTTDSYTEAHHGWAPILVFVDATGGFDNDTECVIGPHGNAEDHLVKDIPPFISATFGASADPRHWGALGFSMGGTCAIDLARHGRYRNGITGWFEDPSLVVSDIKQAHRPAKAAARDGIRTRVVVQPGGHVWQFASEAYADILPWMAQQLGLPGAEPVPVHHRTWSTRATTARAAVHLLKDHPIS